MSKKDKFKKDPEDEKKTLEVDLKKIGMSNGKENENEKLKDLENKFKEINQKLSDLAEEQEEVFRRISMAIGDSQLAMKSVDKTSKDFRKIKSETEEFISGMEEKLESFREEMRTGMEAFSKVDTFEESLEAVITDLKSFKEKAHESVTRLEETQQKKFKELEDSFLEMGMLQEKLAELEETLKKEIGRQFEELKGAFNIDAEIDALSKTFTEKLAEGELNQEELGERISYLEKDLREKISFAVDSLAELEVKMEDMKENFPSTIQGTSAEEMEKAISSFKTRFEEKIRSSEDMTENLKGLLLLNLQNMEEQLKGFKEEFQESLEKVQEKVGGNIEERFEGFEQQLSQFKGLSSHKVEEINQTVQNFKASSDQQIELIATLEVKMESIQEKLAKEIEDKTAGLKQQLDESNRLLHTTKENLSLEMDVLVEDTRKDISQLQKLNQEITSDLALLKEFREKTESSGNVAEQVRENLKTIEPLLQELAKRIDTLSEETDKKFARQNVRLQETADKIEYMVEGKLAKSEGKIQEISSKIETEVLSRMEPLETRITQLEGETDAKLEPLRNDIAKLRVKIDSELDKVKDSWNKLDKAISDSEGALNIAQKSKQDMARMEGEIQESVNRVQSMMGTIKENAIKVDSNLEKINLTIKLIDEARERIRNLKIPTAQMMTATPVTVAGTPMVVGGGISEEELAFNIEDIKKNPDLSDLGFDLVDLLNVMIKHDASDLHLKAGSPPTVRLEGELVPVGSQVLTEEACKKLIFSALTPQQRMKLAKRQEIDFAYSIPEARFRVNAFLQKQSVSAAFRLLWSDIPTISELHLPEVVKKLCDYNHGLVLVTGPAGCGKSTTLASMINYVNENKKLHLITIEDPIEFIHKDKMSIITQREVGTDTDSFSMALKQAVRQDPNVILIGEMRDPETIMGASIAAETGHLVLSTLHTVNTIQAINRMIDVFTGNTQKQFRMLLSTTLRGVISQKLLTRSDESGRIPAVEVLVVTPTIASLIAENKIQEIYTHMSQGGTEGMQTFTQSLTRLFERGIITREEAMFHADQPTEFRLAIEGHSTGTSTIQDDSLMSWL